VKAKIHPEYVTSLVHCACGNSFETRSTKPDLHVEICSNCHPFFTGQQRIVDTAGRVERFAKRLEKSQAVKAAAKPKKPRKTMIEIDPAVAQQASVSVPQRSRAAVPAAAPPEPAADVEATRNAETVPEAQAAPKDEDLAEAASGPASGPATEAGVAPQADASADAPADTSPDADA
jgi:large subunit ribosomal protein L31